jgi:hypothetical protein
MARRVCDLGSGISTEQLDLARKDLAVYEVSKGPTPKEGESEYTEHVKDFHYFRVLRVKVNSGIEK